MIADIVWNQVITGVEFNCKESTSRYNLINQRRRLATV